VIELPHLQRNLRSVLVVDDEPLIRLYVVSCFEEEGFTVFEAESADRAIVMLEENPVISVVVTDVQMPGSLDGLMLAHVVRKRWPPTILIVMSGAVEPGDGELPSKASFFHKPIDFPVVIKEIERIAAIG